MNRTQQSTPVVLRPGAPDDEALVADLLAALSPTTSFHRFMAGLGGQQRTLARGLLRTEADRGAVLALRPNPGGARLVGHACWVVTGGVVDVGVVVTDTEQGQGIGTALFVAAADAGAAAGACAVHLDVYPDNRRLAAALRRRLGRGALAWRHGMLTVDAPLASVIMAMGAAVTSAA